MMDKKELLECIAFFNRLTVTEEDVTTDDERENGQLVLKATYQIDGKSYTTNKLYYKVISNLGEIKNKKSVLAYFDDPVYWLDINTHGWPKGSGQSDLEKIVINEMAADDDFKTFLQTLANNRQTGYIQTMTADGKPGQYYHNLLNNNHWHDLIRLIKAIINAKGEKVSKKYFSRLVFKWDGDKNTDRKRSTLTKHAYVCSRTLIDCLYKNVKSIQMELDNQQLIDLLKYKKQIILQGPPGTGKTYKAKKIAQQLTKRTSINEENIKSLITISKTINSSGNFTSYTIDSYTKNGINVMTTGGKVYEAKFAAIIDSFERRTWENGQVTNGNDSYNAAIAKYIDEQLNRDQFKLIQFHPAYSYEDFVRGITVKPNGQHVAYEAENKVLAQFAERAQKNYLNSKKTIESLSKEKWLDQEFVQFAEEIDTDILENGEYKLNEKVSIIAVEEDAFKYGGNSWEVRNQQRMKFSDVKLEMLAEVQSRKDIQTLNSVSGRAKQHATYDLLVVEKLREFLQTRPPFNTDTAVVEEEKNYLLIIDEINRANLPAVLGELIYALEYRGEVVESMYELDGDSKLVLPPNLYIIGTMNTADRSVGHIDYAIRRRFAFEDIYPSATIIDNVVAEPLRTKAKALFSKVANLFADGNIAPDFKAKDVQLGHSYFLAKTEKELELKLNYEILPLLKEYLKDGILNTSITNSNHTYTTEAYLEKLKQDKWN